MTRRSVITGDVAATPLVGWSVEDAAELADVPAATLRTWATTGFLQPTAPARLEDCDRLVEDRAVDVERSYSLLDCLRARLARDLLEEGVERGIVRQVVKELAHNGAWGLDARRLAEEGLSFLSIVVDRSFAEGIRDRVGGELVAFLGSDGSEQWIAECDEQAPWPAMVYDDDDGEPVTAAVLYPLAEVCSELIADADRRCGELELENPSPWQ